MATEEQWDDMLAHSARCHAAGEHGLICPTHDLCDADAYMHEAVVDVLGDGYRDACDRTWEVMDDAWSIATKRHLCPTCNPEVPS